MEFVLIPQLAIVFFLGIIILILGRNLSKIKEMPDEFLFESKGEKKEKENFLYLYKRLIRRVNKEKYQEKVGLFWVWLEKLLRRLRINFLKIDNKIGSALDKVKEKNVEDDESVEDKGKDQWREYHNPEEAEKESLRIDGENDREKIIEEDKNKNVEEIFEQQKVEDSIPAVSNIIQKEKDDSKKDIEIEKEDIEKENIEIGESDDKLDVKKEKKGNKEKEYLDLILKNPIDIKAYWKLGIVYSRRKNYKDAISCFRQITKIDPSYIKAKKKIVDLMRRMKKKKNGDDGNS